jgi:16S rRNA (uracil1498-N3)-methyltransferase
MPDLTFPHAALRHAHKITVDRRIQLDQREAEALRFRQVNVSEAFTIQAPDGKFFRASLQSIGDKGGEALVYEEMLRSPETPLALTLICAVLSRQRMLLVIPKATELGVMRIQPVITAHSVQAEGLAHEKAHAWQNAAIRAARQCRRSSVPEVCATTTLAEALDAEPWQTARAHYYLDDRATESAKPPIRGPKAACLAVGPEGGWSDEERTLLREFNAAPLAIGGRVLRAETAAITGVFLFQHLLGDLQGK